VAADGSVRGPGPALELARLTEVVERERERRS
jgi:hypothetical protein